MAGQGKTIFVSSHLMSEMALTAEHLIVIGRGRLIADATTEEVIQLSSGSHVRVRSPQSAGLADLITAQGGAVTANGDGTLEVTNMTVEAVGELAAANRVVLHELSIAHASLEQAFMELTDDAVDFRAEPAAAATDDGATDGGSR
jgi:ABC-2 type transport system ATP-binding protein